MAKSERGDRKELIVKNIKSIIEGHPEVSKKVKFNDNSDRHVTGILPQDLQEAVQRVQLFVNKSEPFPINSTEPKDIRDIKILETGLRQFVRILDDHPGLKPVQQEIIKEFYKFAKEGNREIELIFAHNNWMSCSVKSLSMKNRYCTEFKKEMVRLLCTWQQNVEI